MLHPHRIYIVLGLLSVLALVSCGPSATLPAPTAAPTFENSPEGVVRKILDAIEKQDANQYLDALDPTLRNQPNYFFASTLVRGVQSYLGLEGAGNLNQVAFRDLRFQTSNNDGTTANVSASGKIRNLAIATESDFSGGFFTKNIGGTWYVSDLSTMVPPTPSYAVVELVAMEITRSPSYKGAGWSDITIQFAAENGGGKPYRGMWPYEGTVNVAEGFTYPLERQGWAGRPDARNEVANYMLVPPGFRVLGPLYVATVAETTHPVSVRFESILDYLSGEFNIENPVGNLVFPTDLTAGELNTTPDTIELPGVARITVEGFSPETTFGFDYGSSNISAFMQVTFQNLNIGQEQSLEVEDMAFFDGNGVVERWNGRVAIEGSCQAALSPYLGGRDWPFKAGPGQTSTSTICIRLGEPSARGVLSSHNLKVLLWVNEDVWRIYDTGF